MHLQKSVFFQLQSKIEQYLNFNSLQKMETNQAKWKSFHKSTNIITPTQQTAPQKFRTSSREHFVMNDMQKGTRSLANLLLAPSARPESQKKTDHIDYYQIRGKENLKKMEGFLKDQSLLRKQLLKIGESKPQNRVFIESAITLIHNYEQKIKHLQEQLSKYQNTSSKQQHHNTLKQKNNQKEVEIDSKKCFGSEKTVSSLSSIKKIKMLNTTAGSDYYFPFKGNES